MDGAGRTLIVSGASGCSWICSQSGNKLGARQSPPIAVLICRGCKERFLRLLSSPRCAVRPRTAGLPLRSRQAHQEEASDGRGEP